MSDKNQKNHQNQKSGNGHKATPPAKPTSGGTSTDGAKGEKKAKRARVRLQSPKEPKLWVRAYADVIEKHGTPKDPWGNDMVPVKRSFGLSEEEKAARKAAKDAEKQKFDSMTDEEKLAFTKAKREERAKAREAKKENERQALIEQLKKEIAEGRL